MVLLDTSFLYALYSEKDVHHESALQKALEHESKDFFAFPMSVFQELMNLISMRRGPQIAQEIGSELLKEDSPAALLRIDEGYFEDIWKFYKNSMPHKLSYTDAVLFYLSKELGAKIFSFDQELLKLSNSR